MGFSTKELGYQGTLMEKGYAYMVLSIAIEVLGYKVWDFGHRLVYARGNTHTNVHERVYECKRRCMGTGRIGWVVTYTSHHVTVT